MAIKTIDDTYLIGIADAIRSKTGKHDQLTLEQMVSEIQSLGSGDDDVLRSILDGTIEDLTLPDGLTMICDYSFANRQRLTMKSLPESIISIGGQAFNSCVLLNLTSLPDSITNIGVGGFNNCPALRISKLPELLKIVKMNAFGSCHAITSMRFPKGIEILEENCFRNCVWLESVTFDGIPKSIDALAFNGCRNLTTINVPWAEGAVANAPWGATNATINYNYTG